MTGNAEKIKAFLNKIKQVSFILFPIIFIILKKIGFVYFKKVNFLPFITLAFLTYYKSTNTQTLLT